MPSSPSILAVGLQYLWRLVPVDFRPIELCMASIYE